MIPARDYVGARIEQLTGDVRGDSEPSGRILAIGYDETMWIGCPNPLDSRREGSAARPSEDIGYVEYLHRPSLGALGR
jgi:hypothetical protein